MRRLHLPYPIAGNEETHVSSAADSNLVLQIIVASTRPGRVGLPIAEWVRDHAIARGFEVDFADLALIDLPFFNESKHPRLKQYEHQHTKNWSARVEAADAFIIVLPEYNHSFTAPLKNAIDYVFQEWARKPVALVSYGGIAGGTRAVQALKPVLVVLKMTPLVEGITIPFAGNLIKNGAFEPTPSIESSLGPMFDELELISNTLKPLRSRS